MKLFDGFEIVKFHEENLFLVTHNSFIYYIYNSKYNSWRKHRNAGNDSITVCNYDDVTKDELMSAMGGVFPKKETDFMRLCVPSQLCIRDMLALLKEDFPRYMDYSRKHSCYHIVHRILLESDICHKTYVEIRKLFERSMELGKRCEHVVSLIEELSLTLLGRDIFKKEIGIVDGHDGSSYFWIKPVRVLDYSNTNDIDNVAEMRSIEISIEEDDINQYLTPFLYKYFDNELEANKSRVESYWIDDDGKEQADIIEGFEWYLTHNFYTYDSIRNILNDINDTIDALTHRRNTEYTAALKEKRGWATYELLYAKDLDEAHVREYNDNRPTEDTTDIELIIDFYRRFIYRMEYMMRVGEEKGYNLISFMGP